MEQLTANPSISHPLFYARREAELCTEMSALLKEKLAFA